MSTFLPRAALVVALLIATGGAPLVLAQTPNECDPGESPDVTVFDLPAVWRWGSLGGITAFSVATTSCNVGSCWLNWIADTAAHPVIGQNMFRYRDGRFEQIGQSWLKHGFFALSDTLCSDDCESTNGSHLGVNCSDPYSATLNGLQWGLGPKFEVNASTGEFPYPATALSDTGNDIFKRLQVANSDLDPALNPGARYLVEGQYVTADDAAAGNDNNNFSYRPVRVTGSGETFELELVGATVVGRPAIAAWKRVDPAVRLVRLDLPGDGRFVAGVRVTELTGGLLGYEIAIQNLTSHRSARALRVPLPAGALVQQVGFHDVEYHSGEPVDGTDWAVTVERGAGGDALIWATDAFETDPNANALRWGTLYNFRFVTDRPARMADTQLELYRPGPGRTVDLRLAPQRSDSVRSSR